MTEKISEAAIPSQSVIFPFPSEVEKETPSAPPPDTSTFSSFQPPSQKILTLPSLEQRKERPWNADMTGQTGYKWDIPGFQATNLQSENHILNEVYRGINNTVGLGAGIVNYVNNVAGAVLIDLPAKVEEISVRHGGPNFSELVVSAQMATPGFPWDDALAYGFSRVSQFSKSAFNLNQIQRGGNETNQAIKSIENWQKLSLDDISSLHGASPASIKKLIPKSWISNSTRRGDGIRYMNPMRKGDQVRIMPGNPRDPNLIKQGPYLRISIAGKTSEPIPLQGNRALP